jgi:uncharacterized tellurite resistance protein B-like protein
MGFLSGVFNFLDGLGESSNSNSKWQDKSSEKLEMRVHKEASETIGDLYRLSIKGNPQIHLSGQIVAIVKLTDAASNSPIISTLESQQEEGSVVFEHVITLGELKGKYFRDWAQISTIIPSVLVGPYKGTRKLTALVVLCLEGHTVDFENGSLPAGQSQKSLAFFSHDFHLPLKTVGYLEADSERIDVQKAAIKLAVSIALADGSLDQSEGNTIKSWIKDIVDLTDDDSKEDIKSTLNTALEEGFNAQQAGNLSIDQICKSIVDLGSQADKYALLELCLDVMAADGVADPNELREITKISEMINIDYEEMTKLKDQRLITLDPKAVSGGSLEEILGIKSDWESEKIKKHIVTQYAKWNGRLNSLPSGDKRDNAQAMLELLASARKKYS